MVVLFGLSASDARPMKPSNTTNTTEDQAGHHENVEFKVATVDFKRIEWPFMIMIWILVASFAKLGKLC